jgi:hypothetical protein
MDSVELRVRGTWSHPDAAAAALAILRQAGATTPLTSYDVATCGFEDLQLYRELSYTADKRFLQEDAADDPLHQDAADVLRAWADQLPSEVEAKY